MQKTRVAFISNSEPFDGGSETFESSFASILRSIDNLNIVPILLHTQFSKSRQRNKKNSNLNEIYFKVGLLTKALVALQTSLFLSSLSSRLRWPRNKFEKFLRIQGVQVAVFLSPNPLSLIVQSLPLVTTVWDLGHRDLPDLPEFSKKNSFKEREFFYQNTLARSWRVLVDSEITKKRIETIYSVQPNRVHVIGLLPAGPTLEIKNISSDPQSKYIFYPAQFWPHKNHERLLYAFREVLRVNPELKLVLSGSDKGSLATVLNQATALGISDRVEYVGYVARSEYWKLLKNSEFLVFPSLLGPTNLPPLEALVIGKKMAVSLFHKESLQAIESGVSYFDPYSVDEMRDAMLHVFDLERDFKVVNFEKSNKILLTNFLEMLTETHTCN